MRPLAALVAAAALSASAPAHAKLRIEIRRSDPTPAVGQRVVLVVRSELALAYDLRLVAIAPGQPVSRVVATLTGDTSHPDPDIRRHGFEIRLVRIGAGRWRGTARFARPGRWRVVVPTGGREGVIIPNGAALLALDVHPRARS